MGASYLMLASVLWGLEKEWAAGWTSSPGLTHEQKPPTHSPTGPKLLEDPHPSSLGSRGRLQYSPKWGMGLQRVMPSSICQLGPRHPVENKAHNYGRSQVIC